MSEAGTRRHAFSMKVLDSAHAAGLDGPDLGAALINVLATMYAKSANGDAARYQAMIDDTVSALRSFPEAPPAATPLDPARLISDQELTAYSALVRAAIRWTKSPKAKVDSSFELILAELRRLRARVVEVTTFGDSRRRLLCPTCSQTFDGGPLEEPKP